MNGDRGILFIDCSRLGDPVANSASISLQFPCGCDALHWELRCSHAPSDWRMFVVVAGERAG
jgi:hypothetical protein